MKMIGKSIRQIWVNVSDSLTLPCASKLTTFVLSSLGKKFLGPVMKWFMTFTKVLFEHFSVHCAVPVLSIV